jgi:hypothetical protein
LGVASKYGTSNTPIDSILRMQQFQLWGFLFMICAIAGTIWLIQCKLEAIETQYKEQFLLLHRIFKSHQDLQIKVHKATSRTGSAPPPTSSTSTESAFSPSQPAKLELEPTMGEDETAPSKDEVRIEQDEALPDFLQ